MNGTSGFQARRSSTPDHHRIGSCTSNSIDSKQVPGIFSVLTISSLSPQTSAQREKRFLTPFSCLIACLLLIPCLPGISQAQVPPPPTPITSSGLSTEVTTNGTVHDITGGTRPGGASGTNLFHSFGDFGVPANNIANFLNSGSVEMSGALLPPNLPTSNILGRVTGVNPSIIFGMIQTNGPNGFGTANLFLMNPYGFLFGPNATVNVGGMVAFTSADYLRLADNARFNAIPNSTFDALLTPSPVAAFGFLGANPGAITVQGSQFTVTEGSGISLIGGNIAIESGTPEGGTAQPARLSAPNGNIHLASAASPGEFDAITLQSLPNVDGTSFTSFSSAILAPGSTIDVSGTNTVSIRGGQFVLSVNDAAFTTAESPGGPEAISLARGSSIVTSNTGAEPGADVLMAAANIQLDGVSIRSVTSGEGSGANVTMQGDDIALTGGTQVITSAEGAGTGGDITLAANKSLMIGGIDSEGSLVSPFGVPASAVSTLASGSGSGGEVNLSARSITVENNGQILTITSGDGHGGNISLSGETITIQNEAFLFGSAGLDLLTGEVRGAGVGGDIALTATASIRIVGPETPTLLGATLVGSQSGSTGDTGHISVNAPVVTVERGGWISTSNGGTGLGGNISINASDSLTIVGVDPTSGQQSKVETVTSTEADGGSISINAGSVLMSDRGSIITESFGSASSNPGDINLHVTGDLSVTDGASISTSGAENSSGTISILADQILVSGAQPFPSSIQNSGRGLTTGNIEITARALTVSDGARIGMLGTGQLGTISIVASESVDVTNGAKIRMENSSATSGTAGSVMISAPTITMNQAIIQTVTSGAGDAGSVTLDGNRIALLGGQITSETQQIIGRGGDVTVAAQESLTINGSFAGNDIDGPGPAGIFTSTHNLGGDAGNILVRSPLVQITDGGVLSAASTGTGNAGTITVEGTQSPAQSVLIDGPGSGIFTDTQGTGAGGNVFVDADSVTLQNGGTLSAKTSGTESTATGGSITVNATNQVMMAGGASITASSTGPGNAGNVTISGDSLTIASGGRIEASTSGAGDGGSIAITTTGDVTVTDLSADGQVRSGIFAKTQSAGGGSGSGGGGGGSGGGSGGGGAAPKPGSAGDITITANNLLLDGGAQIDSSTTSGGAGGSVSITTAENITIAGSSTRLTSDATRGNGKGGNITLVAKNITVRDNASVTAATGGKGDAGTVTLTALDQLLLQSAGTVTTSTSGSGKGGTITIQAGQVLLDGQGTGITADTLRPFADMTITINILHQNIGDLVVQLDSPTGTRLALLSRVGGNGDNFTGTQFNDQATTQITSGSAPFTGTFTPREPLGQLNNELVAGNWTLNVRDQATGNPGLLESWTLQIGAETFQSTSGSLMIPDNGNVRSTITVANPAVPTVQAVGEPAGIGGNVTINAGTVTVQNGATMSATTRGSGQGGTLTVNATGTVALTGSGSGLFTDSEASGAGGNIFVDADTVTIENGGTLSAMTSGTNNGGDIQVDATAINLLTFASINTLSFLSDGSAGNIALKATQQITAVDSFLNTDAVGGTGLGGNILLRAPTIDVNGGILSATTSGTGHAGNVLLEGQQISLGASPFAVAQGADLFAGTFGSGHGGTVILRGLDGPSSHADNVTISGTSRIHTLTGSDGSAGDITINAAQFTLTDHATLNADTFGSGEAGTITITATDHATVSGLSTMVSSSSDFGATGNAGQISVSAPTVMIENGGSISTNTTGEGTGGNINILASQSVTMTNGSSISASSTGPGNAGNILINAGQNYTSADSAVTTQAAQASGGNITVLATDMVQLTNSQLNASVQGSSTTVGGNITIDPQYVILQNSQILAQATQGQGGAILITITNGGLFLPDANSTVSASSQFGVNGTVTIQSPNAPASGKIQPLGKTPLQATSLLNQRCAALAGGEFSSFTVAGRDSLPTEPSSWLASPLAFAMLSEGSGLGMKAEGVKAEGERPVVGGETALLSLRQIAPAGFLTQTFAVDWSAGCTS